MAKRREVVRLIRKAGFHPTEGTNHEHWTDGTRFTQVPRHSEISDQMLERIKKRAGLK